MASVLPFDELNRFNTHVREWFNNENISSFKKVAEEDIIDELLDLLLLAYATGNEVTNDYLSGNWQPSAEDVEEVVNEKVDGKTWEDRVRDYFSNGGTGEDLIRIAETETHRVANTSALLTAREDGATTKTWKTMLDDRVRESHDYLEGVTVGINDEFITFDGDRASAPGLFSLAENNVNCRCELIFS